MRRPARLVLGILVAAGFLAAVAFLTETPVTVASDDVALLRLSWRMKAPPGEACRRPTAEELAELPVHMRDPNACIGGVHRAWELAVSVDGAEMVRDTVLPAGRRGDRPIFVFREVPLMAGARDISVRFRPLPASEGGSGQEEGLAWSETVPLAPRQITVLTHDPELDRLTLLAESPRK